MANRDAPFGLRPIGHMGGGTPARQTAYSIANGYDTNIFRGDVVEGVAGGGIERAPAPNVDNLGVFWGCKYTDTDGKPQFRNMWPANQVASDAVAYVIDDPMTLFAIQGVSGTAFTLDMRNALVDFTATAGDTSTGISAEEAALAILNPAGGGSLRIHDIFGDPENEVAEHAVIVVSFAEHVLKGVVAGVGGV